MKCALGISFYQQVWGDVSLLLVVFAISVCLTMLLRLKRRQRVWSRAAVFICGVLVLYMKYPSVMQSLLLGKCRFLCNAWSLAGVAYLVACGGLCSFKGGFIFACTGRRGPVAYYASQCPPCAPVRAQCRNAMDPWTVSIECMLT